MEGGAVTVNLETLAIFGGPIITFAVTFGVMHYRLNQVVADQQRLEKMTRAIHNWARWYLTEKEHLPLDRINKILGDGGEEND